MLDSLRPSRSAGLGPVERALQVIEVLALGVSIVATVALMVLICVSVIGRYFFAAPIPDDVVIAENLMPLIVAFPFAFVAARRGHIEVEIFTSWLPRRALHVLGIFAHVLGLAIFGAIAWSLWKIVLRDIGSGQYYEGMLEIPVWPAKAIFIAALVLFCVRLLVMIADDVRQAIHPRTPRARSDKVSSSR